MANWWMKRNDDPVLIYSISNIHTTHIIIIDVYIYHFYLNMSCLQSFDNLCKKIVSPTRHLINEQELSIHFIIQSNANLSPTKLITNLYKSLTAKIKYFPPSSSQKTWFICQQFYISMATVAINSNPSP